MARKKNNGDTPSKGANNGSGSTIQPKYVNVSKSIQELETKIADLEKKLEEIKKKIDAAVKVS